MSAPSELLKILGKSEPKILSQMVVWWWFTMVQSKTPPETNPSTNGPKLFTSWQIRRATIWEEKNISEGHPSHGILAWIPGIQCDNPGKENSIKSHPQKKIASKNGSTKVPSLKPSLFFFWQQKATQKTTGSRSSFSSSLRRKGRSRSKSRPRWKWAKPRCEKKMGNYFEDGLPGRTLQWLGITKGNLERGTTLLRGLIKSYQPLSLINHLLTGMILQVWSL